jgi:hypothetical protein
VADVPVHLTAPVHRTAPVAPAAPVHRTAPGAPLAPDAPVAPVAQVPEVQAPARPASHPKYAWPEKSRLLGTRVSRVDGPVKATGRAKYSYDISRPGMLYGKILRSPHAHARVKSIDISAAQKAPGVRSALATIQPGQKVMYAGEEIAAVAALTRPATRFG